MIQELKSKKEYLGCCDCNQGLSLITETPVGMAVKESVIESGKFAVYYQRTAYYECPKCKAVYSQTRSRQAVPIEKTYSEMMSGWLTLIATECSVNIVLGEVDKGELCLAELKKEWGWLKRSHIEDMAEKATTGEITLKEMNNYLNQLWLSGNI